MIDIEKTLRKVFNEELKPIAIDNDSWEIIKTEFNNSLKQKKKIYNFIEETYNIEEIFKEEKTETDNEDTNSTNDIEEIFDDILVYN